MTGERIADLSARPLAPSPEAHDAPAPEAAPAPAADEVEAGRARVSRSPIFPGLISRVLESADQLAASTRRTRKGSKVTSQEQASPDHPVGMNRPGSAPSPSPAAFASADPVDRRPRRRHLVVGEPIGDVLQAIGALRSRGTGWSSPPTTRPPPRPSCWPASKPSACPRRPADLATSAGAAASLRPPRPVGQGVGRGRGARGIGDPRGLGGRRWTTGRRGHGGVDPVVRFRHPGRHRVGGPRLRGAWWAPTRTPPTPHRPA